MLVAALARPRRPHRAAHATRGDGGQNEIGPELFEALGVLRTEELAAHPPLRRRASSTSPAPTSSATRSAWRRRSQKWGREETLGDVVRVIRAVPAGRDPDPAAGGAGRRPAPPGGGAARAWRRSGPPADPARFPEQSPRACARGRRARSTRAASAAAGETPRRRRAVSVPTGVYDPLLGMTWQELGQPRPRAAPVPGSQPAAGRPGRGPRRLLLPRGQRARGSPATESDVLDGVDTSLRRCAASRPDRRRGCRSSTATWRAAEARSTPPQAAFDRAGAREDAAAAARRARRAARRCGARIEASGLRRGPSTTLVDRLADEESDVAGGAGPGPGLAFEARVDDDDVVPGPGVHGHRRVFNQGPRPGAVDGPRAAGARGLDGADGLAGAPRDAGAGQGAGRAVRRDGRRERTAVAAVLAPARPGVDRYDVDDPRARRRCPGARPTSMAALDWRTGTGGGRRAASAGVVALRGPLGGRREAEGPERGARALRARGSRASRSVPSAPPARRRSSG